MKGKELVRRKLYQVRRRLSLSGRSFRVRNGVTGVYRCFGRLYGRRLLMFVMVGGSSFSLRNVTIDWGMQWMRYSLDDSG